MDGQSLSLGQVQRRAHELLGAFEAQTATAPYESKGVLFSEMLFVCAVVTLMRPQKVFESGRARGVSTFFLGACLPDVSVVSLEWDRDSADVPIAARHLERFDNVSCLFGDAQEYLPKQVQPGDVVLIDGPKQFRALRLAFQLLGHQRPAAVLLHDCYLGSCERTFLDANLQDVFYSDDDAFVAAFHDLDEPCWQQRHDLLPDEFPEPHLAWGRPSSYGPTMACIPYNASVSYGRLLRRSQLAGLTHRWRKSLGKRKWFRF